jgi:hypothetical protein
VRRGRCHHAPRGSDALTERPPFHRSQVQTAPTGRDANLVEELLGRGFPDPCLQTQALHFRHPATEQIRVLHVARLRVQFLPFDNLLQAGSLRHM